MGSVKNDVIQIRTMSSCEFKEVKQMKNFACSSLP